MFYAMAQNEDVDVEKNWWKSKVSNLIAVEPMTGISKDRFNLLQKVADKYEEITKYVCEPESREQNKVCSIQGSSYEGKSQAIKFCKIINNWQPDDNSVFNITH